MKKGIRKKHLLLFALIIAFAVLFSFNSSAQEPDGNNPKTVISNEPYIPRPEALCPGEKPKDARLVKYSDGTEEIIFRIGHDDLEYEYE